jgi:hypothetical protein
MICELHFSPLLTSFRFAAGEGNVRQRRRNIEKLMNEFNKLCVCNGTRKTKWSHCRMHWAVHGCCYLRERARERARECPTINGQRAQGDTHEKYQLHRGGVSIDVALFIYLFSPLSHSLARSHCADTIVYGTAVLLLAISEFVNLSFLLSRALSRSLALLYSARCCVCGCTYLYLYSYMSHFNSFISTRIIVICAF